MMSVSANPPSTAIGPCYRVRPSLDRSPAGHDGKGWNRLAIIPMDPIDRCLLRPKYRQAALDTLRGMGHYGVPTAYYVHFRGAVRGVQPATTATRALAGFLGGRGDHAGRAVHS